MTDFMYVQPVETYTPLTQGRNLQKHFAQTAVLTALLTQISSLYEPGNVMLA